MEDLASSYREARRDRLLEATGLLQAQISIPHRVFVPPRRTVETGRKPGTGLKHILPADGGVANQDIADGLGALQPDAHAEFVDVFGGLVTRPPDWWEPTAKGLEYLRGDLDAQYHHPPPGYRRHAGSGRPGTVYP